MYHIAEEHENTSHPHAIKILNNFQGYSRKGLRKLEEKNYVKVEGEMWNLTDEGFKVAGNLYNQNLKDE